MPVRGGSVVLENDGDESSYVDPAPPTQPLRYETDVSTVASFTGEASTFCGASTIASEFPDNNHQKVILEYLDQSQSTIHAHEGEATQQVEVAASNKFLQNVERSAPRQPLRYDTCSEATSYRSEYESDMESIHSRVSQLSGVQGAPAWALQVLRTMQRSEGGGSVKQSGRLNLPPSQPVRYDSEVESMLESLAEETVSLGMFSKNSMFSDLDESTVDESIMDEPDLEAAGQVVPPDWAIQYLRKVAQSESSETFARVEPEPPVQQAPPIFEVVASKNAPTKPKRSNSTDMSDPGKYI